jgi:hypothetical protein
MIKVTVDTGTHTDQIFLSRLSYVLDFIQNHPCAPADVLFVINETRNADIIIHYSENNGTKQIMPQVYFFEPGQRKVCDCTAQNFEHKNILLKGFCHRGATSFMAIDIFETIFFHISRYEEWYCTENQLDKHGVMASNEQYLVKNGLHTKPIVDLLVKYFFEKLGLIPKEIETTFTMTHDIDVLQKYPSFYKFLRGYGNIILYHKL